MLAVAEDVDVAGVGPEEDVGSEGGEAGHGRDSAEA
jgi:hypothetical protein